MQELSVAVADFVDHKRAAGLAPKSIEQYAGVLKLFERFGAANGIITTAQLDQRVVDRWQSHVLDEDSTRTGKKLSRASARTYVRTLAIFVKWLQNEDLVG